MTGLTPTELAHRVRHTTGHRATTRLMVETLNDWRERGIATEHLGRWHLTDTGKAMFGAYVNNLYLADDREAA